MKRVSHYLLLALLSACTPFTRMSITNVNDVNNIGSPSYLYALPQSCFAVTVVAGQESFMPGPYHLYAEKYLGIPDAVSKPYHRWRINSMSITPYKEADPDFLFSINGTRSASFLTLVQDLQKDSLVLLPGDFSPGMVFISRQEYFTGDQSFTDFSVKRNFEADKDILISEILPDSLWINLPASKEKNGPLVKTTEQKAEEAANFILKIRKRRFKLISGQYSFMPDGESLGRAVDELNRIEAGYVSLFTGRKSTSTVTRTFHFVPQSNEETSRIILFRFSETEGFVYSEEADGKPVLVEIRDMNKTKSLDALVIDRDKSQQYLLYRIPDQANISISYGEEKVKEAIFPVYQYGSLVPGWKK